MDLYKARADGNAHLPPLGGAETVDHCIMCSCLVQGLIFLLSSVKKLIGTKIHTLQNAQYICIKI